MQVFKLYFKILRSYLNFMLMYIGIFLCIFLGLIIPQVSQLKNEDYTQSQCDFAVFDYDNSELSNALIQYLQTIHHLEKIADDEKETIQDELYELNVHCVIRVKEGFEQAFERGEGAEFLELFSIPNTTVSVLFEQNLQSYLNVVHTYQSAGFEIKEAITQTALVMDTSVEVDFVDQEGAASERPIYYFYKYVNWVFIAMCVNSISTVLLSLDKKKLRDRIQCSAYPFLRMNLEIILGVLTTGFLICSFCIVMVSVVYPKEMLEPNGIFYILNAFCAMAVTLAITFLISKVTNKPQVISLMSNVVGLGMAFLCGVFVPLDFLSETVVQIAHFLPVYWNVRALQMIERYQAEDRGTLFLYMGIQLLFAVAILCIGMVIARRKRITNE